MSRWPRNIISIALIVIAVVSFGAALQVWVEANSNNKAGGTPTPSAKTTPTTSASPSSSPAPTPATVSSIWSTGSTQRSVPAISPAPRLVAIRTGAHTADGYDRIAFDFSHTSAPGHRVEYVDQIVRDGSGQTVTLAGSSYLQLVFTPAVIHDDAGKTSFSIEPVKVDYPRLKSYVINGNFEGQLSVALGLSGRNGYRISQSRTNAAIWTVYVDVR